MTSPVPPNTPTDPAALVAEVQRLRHMLVALKETAKARELKLRDVLSAQMRNTLETWRAKATATMAEGQGKVRQLAAELDAARHEVDEGRKVIDKLRIALSEQQAAFAAAQRSAALSASVAGDGPKTTGPKKGTDAEFQALEQKLAGLEEQNLAALERGKKIAKDAFGGTDKSGAVPAASDAGGVAAALAADRARAEKLASEQSGQATLDATIREAEAALEAAQREAERRIREAQAQAAKAADAARSEAQAALDAVLTEAEHARREGDAAKKHVEEMQEGQQTVLDAVLAEAEAARAEQDAIKAERDALAKERDALAKERDALKETAAKLQGKLDALGRALSQD